MSFEPSFEEQELLAETLEHNASGLSTRELLLGVLTASTYALIVAGIWMLRPPHAFAIVPAIVCFVVLALATGVSFDMPLGIAPASQLGFVPLLFAVPLALVPLAAMLAFLPMYLRLIHRR